MSCKDLPYQIPRVDVLTFTAAAKAKKLSDVRNRRLFGIVNTDASNPLKVYLKKNGDGDPITLAPMTGAGKYDGGSLEINGYNGEVWVADGAGYIYYFES